jgi:hypothetical protein
MVLASGCANLNTAFRTNRLDTGVSAFIDAKQRAIISRMGPDGRPIICAEPGPDVFTANGGAFSANGSGNGTSLGLAGATSESAGAISAPTTAILAQRGAYYRICEAYMNGASDDIDVMLGIRNNQRSLAGIIAIEQLTGAVRAPSTVLSASGSSSTGQLLNQLSASRQTEVDRRAQYQTHLDQLTHDRDALEERKAAIVPAAGQSALTPEQTQLRDDLDRQITAKEADMTDARGAITASTNIIASLDTAIAAARDGGAATTSTGIIINNGGSTVNGQTAATLAEAVTHIVDSMNSDDYGPTECLAIMRRASATTPPGVLSQCGEILTHYSDALGSEAEVQRMLARAGQHIIDRAIARRQPLTAQEIQFLQQLASAHTPIVLRNE